MPAHYVKVPIKLYVKLMDYLNYRGQSDHTDERTCKSYRHLLEECNKNTGIVYDNGKGVKGIAVDPCSGDNACVGRNGICDPAS